MTRSGPLAPLVRALPQTAAYGERWIRSDIEDTLCLISSATAIDAGEWWQIACGVDPRPDITTSRSSADRHRVLAMAGSGPLGVDLERLDRVARNATGRDGWLAQAEQAQIASADDPLLELACHWVLKEAYGKALDVGLALPLDALAFGGEGCEIVLRGSAAPMRRDGWRFHLFRQGNSLIAVARRRSLRQARHWLPPAGNRRPRCSTARAT